MAVLITLVMITGCGPRPVFRFETLPSDPIPQIPEELRGIWITRFEWAHPDSAAMRQRIADSMRRAADANFNAVFFQVRGQAETLYPSPIESWSKLVGAKDPGFDPVAFAIDEAHRRGLNFYAYINLMPLWNGDTPPEDPDHLYFSHGPEVDPGESWVCFDPSGRPMKRNEYFYLNPALPEVKTYLKSVIRHFVMTYDIDGLHFDRIRYPGAEYINDPYSLNCFRQDSLNTPMAASPMTKDEWARRTLTDLVEDVVVEAMLVKPHLVNSAATWGLYRTDDIPGYGHFGSGYHRYFQDGIDWLDRGIFDFIVPMIYWDMNDPLPNFHDLWLDFKRRTPNSRFIFPGLRLKEDWIPGGETASQIHFVRQNGGFGTVLFSSNSLSGDDAERLRRIVYPRRVRIPERMKRTSSDQVLGLDMKPVLGQVHSGRRVSVNGTVPTKATDSEGRIGVILPDRPDRVVIHTEDRIVDLDTEWWRTPYDYIIGEDGGLSRKAPWIECRRLPADTTDSDAFHVLCRTSYPAQAWIDGDSVKVYKTGIFFKQIELEAGLNRISVRVRTADSSEALYERNIIHEREDRFRQPFPLWIDERSIEPQAIRILPPDDVLEFRFEGSRGQNAFIIIKPGNIRLVCKRRNAGDYSVYTAELPLRMLRTGKRYTAQITLRSHSSMHRLLSLTVDLPSAFEVLPRDAFPLIRTVGEMAVLYHSMGRVRLGAPIRAEYGPGVVLKTNGMIGDIYRVELSRNDEGYIRNQDVEEIYGEKNRPGYLIRSIDCFPLGATDGVRIPYPESVPYTVRPEPEAKRIRIALFGVKSSSTWIRHFKGRRLIRHVTWRQATPETYEVIVHLNTQKIWGYDIVNEEGSLLLRVKHPPSFSKSDTTGVLSGLRIAIEAGHGGENVGAVGLSGLFEKDVNLDVARRLAEICRTNGADIFMVREQDEYLTLASKRRSIIESRSNLLVSIHANAASLHGGYLRVGGASTYYHNPFWAEFAEIMFKHLTSLELDPYGVIGSFNYLVTRMSNMPAILVEQAFMSHAEDEEKLASESFRQSMAEAVFAGIVEYVQMMRASE